MSPYRLGILFKPIYAAFQVLFGYAKEKLDSIMILEKLKQTTGLAGLSHILKKSLMPFSILLFSLQLWFMMVEVMYLL